MKGKVTVRELYKPKVRCKSANSPKRCSLYSDLLTSLSSSLTQPCLPMGELVLRGNGLKRKRANNQSNFIIYPFDLRQTLPKYLRTILNEFEAHKICYPFHPYSAQKAKKLLCK